MTRADLHSHSSASDGTLSPAAVVARAATRGLTVLALTDHDSTDGLAEAHVAASEHGITLVPGIEVNARWDGREVHVLGYFIDETSDALQRALDAIRRERDDRIPMMVERLREIDVHVSVDDVRAMALGRSVGRPHVAEALVRAGYASSVDDAFGRYLARGRPAYIEGHHVSPKEAIELIRAAGGVPVLAHPALLDRDADLGALVDDGLAGIEAIYPLHDEGRTQTYIELCERYDLVITGGSDFHGPDRRAEIATVFAPEDAVEQLEKRRVRVTS